MGIAAFRLGTCKIQMDCLIECLKTRYQCFKIGHLQNLDELFNRVYYNMKWYGLCFEKNKERNQNNNYERNQNNNLNKL